ncbi:MAG: hypothetical protein WC043_06075 [Pseudobdellovibrionaceae bacterium]
MFTCATYLRSAVLLACLCLITTPTHAGEVTPFKECATLRNAAPQIIMGVIRTAPFKFKGKIERHEANFSLNEGESVEICSTGPFYEGYKVDLTIRTLIPLFSCKTRLSGEIVLRRKEDENGNKLLYADCK